MLLINTSSYRLRVLCARDPNGGVYKYTHNTLYTHTHPPTCSRRNRDTIGTSTALRTSHRQRSLHGGSSPRLLLIPTCVDRAITSVQKRPLLTCPAEITSSPPTTTLFHELNKNSTATLAHFHYFRSLLYVHRKRNVHSPIAYQLYCFRMRVPFVSHT